MFESHYKKIDVLNQSARPLLKKLIERTATQEEISALSKIEEEIIQIQRVIGYHVFAGLAKKISKKVN